jgi:hypothetical protein
MPNTFWQTAYQSLAADAANSAGDIVTAKEQGQADDTLTA